MPLIIIISLNNLLIKRFDAYTGIIIRECESSVAVTIDS